MKRIIGILILCLTITAASAQSAFKYTTSNPTGAFTNTATNTTVWNKASSARYWRIIRSGATTVTGTSAAKISAAN